MMRFSTSSSSSSVSSSDADSSSCSSASSSSSLPAFESSFDEVDDVSSASLPWDSHASFSAALFLIMPRRPRRRHWKIAAYHDGLRSRLLLPIAGMSSLTTC
eukprot:2237508-Heterocapsa_arctica.AAC.1